MKKLMEIAGAVFALAFLLVGLSTPAFGKVSGYHAASPQVVSYAIPSADSLNGTKIICDNLGTGSPRATLVAARTKVGGPRPKASLAKLRIKPMSALKPHKAGRSTL